MKTTPEQHLHMLQAIAVPVEFKGFGDMSLSYPAGVFKGRTDVLEDLSKFGEALLTKAQVQEANGDMVAAKRTATAGGALVEFTQDFIKRMREGMP